MTVGKVGHFLQLHSPRIFRKVPSISLTKKSVRKRIQSIGSVQDIELHFQSVTPDDKTFVAISRLYASKHTNMHQGKGLCEDDDFPNGITNGAKWYIVEGGMQVINIVLY